MGELLSERKGMKVWRDGDKVIKRAFDSANMAGLRQMYKCLMALQYNWFAPRMLYYNDLDELHMSFEPDTPVTDPELARKNYINMLWDLRQAGIVHGDMTAGNLHFNDNSPVVLDFDQATFVFKEPRPQVHPRIDIFHSLPVAITKAGDPSRVLQRWHGLRDYIQYYAGWGSFLEVGCHRGDFPALAAVEGFHAFGTDGEFIRPCLDDARRFYGDKVKAFTKVDLSDPDTFSFKSNVVMLFSTWVYLIHQQGEKVAQDALRRAVDQSDILLFETQLLGDGPGLPIHTTKEDVVNYLYKVGASKVTEGQSLPKGKDCERTVWIVE